MHYYLLKELLTHAFWANFVDEQDGDYTNNDDADSANDDKHPRVVPSVTLNNWLWK